MPDIPKNLMSQNFFDELEETMEKMGTLVGQINPRFALSAVEEPQPPAVCLMGGVRQQCASLLQ